MGLQQAIRDLLDEKVQINERIEYQLVRNASLRDTLQWFSDMSTDRPLEGEFWFKQQYHVIEVVYLTENELIHIKPGQVVRHILADFDRVELRYSVSRATLYDGILYLTVNAHRAPGRDPIFRFQAHRPNAECDAADTLEARLLRENYEALKHLHRSLEDAAGRRATRC